MTAPCIPHPSALPVGWLLPLRPPDSGSKEAVEFHMLHSDYRIYVETNKGNNYPVSNLKVVLPQLVALYFNFA